MFCLPDGEVRNREPGQGLKPRDLAQKGQSRRAFGDFSKLELFQSLELFPRQAFPEEARRRYLHLKVLQVHQTPQLRREQVDLVAEELELLQAPEPSSDGFGDQSEHISEKVESFRRIFGIVVVVEKRKLKTLAGEIALIRLEKKTQQKRLEKKTQYSPNGNMPRALRIKSIKPIFTDRSLPVLELILIL